MAYLARKKRKAKDHQIIKGKRRAFAINAIMDILNDWRSSPFEYEGTLVAGLRSSLCLDGNRWSAADSEARSLVIEALNRNGAVRPNWDQGQPYYTQPPDACLACGKSMPSHMISSGRKGRFCSAQCAGVVLRRQDRAGAIRESALMQSAARIVRRERFQLRCCEHCQKEYRPFNRETDMQKFCSLPCYWAAKKSLDERCCEACGVRFQPAYTGQVYCSRNCITNHMRAVSCRGCGSTFHSSSKKATFCSEACRYSNRKVALAQEKGGVPAGIERELRCEHCGMEFVATSMKPRYCGAACKMAAARDRRSLRAGSVIQLGISIYPVSGIEGDGLRSAVAFGGDS